MTAIFKIQHMQQLQQLKEHSSLEVFMLDIIFRISYPGYVTTVACYNTAGWSKLDDLQSTRHYARTIINRDSLCHWWKSEKVSFPFSNP